MTGYLIDVNGQTMTLPPLLSWDISHGLGEPCDAFEVSFLYSKEMLKSLWGAVRFKAEHDGKTVFCGVVDEYEISADGSGLVADVRGRSLAALLLDNECESTEYANVGLDFILRRHVYPWGVKNVRTKAMSTAGSFTVASGQSQWSVLREFCWFAGNVMPRFSADGVLLLDGEKGNTIILKADTPVTAALLRDDRYGVISQALVKSRAKGGGTSTVTNAAYAARGASCRRVISVPRHSSYDLMRHTAQYQISRSQSGKRVCEITLPGLFAAFAGDIAALDYPPFGLYGNYNVYESRCWADKKSAGTTLTLDEM